jgi:hypothetical protein
MADTVCKTHNKHIGAIIFFQMDGHVEDLSIALAKSLAQA